MGTLIIQFSLFLFVKILNFYPFYEDLLETGKKTTTIRMGDKTTLFSIDDQVQISIGWNLDDICVIDNGVITSVYSKKISEIVKEDVIGESPDCQNIGAIKYVLSSIYRRVLTDSDLVTIIKWSYL